MEEVKVTKVVKEDGTIETTERKGEASTITVTNKDGKVLSTKFIIEGRGLFEKRKAIEIEVGKLSNNFKPVELEEKPTYSEFDKITSKLFEKKCGKCKDCNHKNNNKKQPSLEDDKTL